MWLLWPFWHLNILQHVDTELREHIRRISNQVIEASVRSYIDLINVLRKSGNENPGNEGRCAWPMIWFEENGQRNERTPYSYYRMRMYEHIKKLTEIWAQRPDWESRRITESLHYALQNIERMEFIIQMTVADIKSWKRAPDKIDSAYGMKDVSARDSTLTGVQTEEFGRR